MFFYHTFLISTLCISFTFSALRDPNEDLGFTYSQLLDSRSRSKPTPEELVIQGIDFSVDRCEDFYQYACGNFLNQSKSGYIYSASLSLDQTVLPIIQKDPMLNNFFLSCQEAVKTTPSIPTVIKAALDQLSNAKTLPDIIKVLGDLSRDTPVNVFCHNFLLLPTPRDPKFTARLYFDFGVMSEFQNKDLIKQFIQKEDIIKQSRIRRTENELHSLPQIKVVKNILADETYLKKPKDPNAQLSVQDIVTSYPKAVGPIIKAFFQGNDLKKLLLDSRFEVSNLANIESYLTRTSVKKVKDVIKMAITSTLAQIYPRVRTKTPDGISRACYYSMSETLKDLIGREYLKHSFSEEKEKTTTTLVNNIIKESKDILADDKSIYDKPTRDDFARKINNVKVHIGGKKETPSYSNIAFSANDYFGNMATVAKICNTELKQAIGKTLNGLTMIQPAQVNAFYFSLTNDLYIPAGILHYPMYDSAYPLAMKYAVLAYVLSHELTHSIDPHGLNYDEFGEKKSKYYSSLYGKEMLDANKKCFVEEYSKLEVHSKDGTYCGKVDGQLTIGENVADSGLELAYRAFKKSQDTEGIADFNANQLFFLASAQVWCRDVDTATAKYLLTEDVHSPSKPRVNGVLMNNPDFAEAFSCVPGSKMNPIKKCHWYGM